MKFAIAFLAIVAVVAAGDSDKEAQVLRINSNVGVDNYEFGYETSNGLLGEAHGELRNFGKDSDAIVSTGAFSWPAPEGQKVAFTYVADENGYQPQSDVLPTPHPIPVAILRSLEWNAAHPEAAEPKH